MDGRERLMAPLSDQVGDFLSRVLIFAVILDRRINSLKGYILCDLLKKRQDQPDNGRRKRSVNRKRGSTTRIEIDSGLQYKHTKQGEGLWM